MIYGIGNVLFSTYSQTLNGQDPVLASGETLEHVETLRGPILVNRKLTMMDKPNIGSRCCSRIVHTVSLDWST